MLIDTHCHIHESYYSLDVNEVIDRAHLAGVEKMICVGTDEASSLAAVDFAASHNGVFATVGFHPHEAKFFDEKFYGKIDTENPLILAVGEIGLDYHYDHSPRDLQVKALESQIDFAIKSDLPIVFHVREAFDDFWPIFDNFASNGRIKAVLHGFTDSSKNAGEALDRGLYFGVNGFSTFVKSEDQKSVYSSIPLENIILETDAPFLTPLPFRGRINEPAYVKNIAEYHSVDRGVSFQKIAEITTANAYNLFQKLK